MNLVVAAVIESALWDSFSWFEFTALLVAFGINAVVPGADFAMVLRQSVFHGRKIAIFTSIGIALSILVHGTYTILGIGLIISQSLLMFSIIKILGALYLLWLGISTFWAATPQEPQLEATENGHAPSLITAILTGFLTNLLNPKAVLFFVALFSTIVSADTTAGHKSLYVATMSLELFLWFWLVSIFFTTTMIRQIFFKIGKWFNRVTGATLVLLAAGVAASTRN